MERIASAEEALTQATLVPVNSKDKEVVVNGVTVLEQVSKAVPVSKIELVVKAWDRAHTSKIKDPGSEDHIKDVSHLCDLIANNRLALDVLLGKREVIDQ